MSRQDPDRQSQSKISRKDILLEEFRSQRSQTSNSSFTLADSSLSDSGDHKIDTVLGKLGLMDDQQPVALSNAVNNVISNFIHVDHEEVEGQYDEKYKQQYGAQTGSQEQKANKYIFVSEFQDIEYLEGLEERTVLHKIYKSVRLTLKKISLLSYAIVSHDMFEYTILLIIILNSLKMALDDPLAPNDDQTPIETAFLILYCCQMVFKILAYGFMFNRGSYLRDPWNILDFIIVVTSVMPLFMTLNFSVNSLRAVRVLRPLKTITKVKVLKMIVRTLFLSFSLVLDSVYILVFVMMIFAIAGLQLFGGVLKNRCMDVSTGILTEVYCTTDCSSAGVGYECVRGIASPNFSIANFDTFPWAMLTVFQILTMEGWSSIMIALELCYSPVCVAYCVLIIFFCEYVLLNMTMAILKYKYAQVKGNTAEQEEDEKFQFTPELLKKIGVYKDFACLKQCQFQRFQDDKRHFVGSIDCYHLETQEKTAEVVAKPRVIVRKYSKMNTELLKKQKKAALLHQRNEQFEVKWDPKTLKFQPIIFEHLELDHRAIRSRQNLKQQLEDLERISENNDIQQDDAEYFDEDQELEELNHKAKNHDADSFATEKMLAYLNKPKQQKEVKDLFELNNLLDSIEKPEDRKKLCSLKYLSNKSIAFNMEDTEMELPDLRFDDKKRQRFFNYFGNLGRFGINIRTKEDQKTIDNNRHNIQDQRTRPNRRETIKKIADEIQLDIKQLELVNELSKKKMKCRLKSTDLLEAQTAYDIMEILKPKKKKNKILQEDMQRQNVRCSIKIEYQSEDAKLQNKSKETAEAELKRKSKIMRKMSRTLQIPNINHDILQIFRANCKVEESNKEPRKQTLQSEEMFKARLKGRSITRKKADDEQPTEVDLIRQYFSTNDPNGRKKQKVVQEDVKPLKAKEVQKQDDTIPQNLEEMYCSIKSSDMQSKVPVQLEPSTKDILEQIGEEENASVNDLNILEQEYEIYVSGMSGIVKVVRNKICIIISSPFYDNLMLLLVLANTIVLSLTGLVDSDIIELKILNSIFTYSFALDVSLKLIAYGSSFFEDVMNLFDLFVVVVSLVDACLEGMTLNLSALRSMRIFRAFRVLRVTRLVRSLSFMKIVMSVVVSVVSEFAYIFMLLALFIFIYTLLGMQIFGGTTLPQEVTGIRQNFNTFFNSVFSVFQLLTVENWNDIQTLIGTSSNSYVTLLFPISWIFIGNWILMNLLQAILLDGFDENTNEVSNDPDEQAKTKKEDEQSSRPQTLATRNYTRLKLQTTQTLNHLNTVQDKDDYSLFLFSKTGKLRIMLTKFLKSKFFQIVIIICIALSSLKLVFDTYIEDPESQADRISNILDMVFNCIFILEACLAIISQGFIIGEGAYLDNNWSKLDFFIIVTAIIDMSLTNVDLSVIKMLRTLRPLRILTRNLNMKIIITALGHSMVGIFNVIIIIILIFIMFGILAITLLQNKLYYCSLNPVNNLYTYGQYGPYNLNKSTCESMGGVWLNQFINFDNILNSLVSLYVFSTRQNWPYYVYTFMDAEVEGPVKDNSPMLFFIFSVVFIFVSSYFFMDLLVGVLFLNFHQAESKLRPKILLDCQINWINLQKLIVHTNPCLNIFIRPENTFKRVFFDIINHRYYQWFSLSCICLNILSMTIDTDDQTAAMQATLKNINLFFSAVFLIEMILKLCAYGKNYFIIGWNIFDFIVVGASILDFALDKIGVGLTSSALSVLPQIARISRVLRVTRILRMFKRFRGLQKLIETFIFMMPALANGLALIALFLFICSVISSYLMQQIVKDGSGFYSESMNFKNFHSALHLLFVCTTGENWYVYMFESIYPGYVSCQKSQNCTSSLNLLFWLCYIFFSQKVFMEMFALIVLDQFESNYINENNPLGIYALLEDDFRSVWIEKTVKHKAAKLQSKKLVDLILHLKPPLGMGVRALQQKYEEELKENKNLTEADIKSKGYEFYMKLKHTSAKWALKMESLLNQNYITYHETFYNCAKYAYMAEFLDKTTMTQLEKIETENKQCEEELKTKRDVKDTKGKNGQDEAEEEGKNLQMNPMQTILFSQMVINSWKKYAEKKMKPKEERKSRRESQAKTLKPVVVDDADSYLDSCSSGDDQAKLEILDNFKKRRQGQVSIQPDSRLQIPDTQNYKDSQISISKKPIRRSRLRPSAREPIKQLRFADSDTFSQFNRSDAFGNSDFVSKS